MIKPSDVKKANVEAIVEYDYFKKDKKVVRGKAPKKKKEALVKINRRR